MSHHVFPHFTADGYFGCFRFLANINKVATNIPVFLSWYYVCISAGNAGNGVELLGHRVYIF